MMPLKKLIITPYFGQFPEWMDLFLADFQRTMAPQGYKLLMDTDLSDFKERVREKLGIDYPGVRGNGKAWDMRSALGYLYEEELEEAEYWGHCDFDVVWGNVSKFLPDKELEQLDVFSSHDSYVCGFFSLYRNRPEVNQLFRDCPTWKMRMEDPEPNGWVESDFSRILEISGLKYRYSSYQGNPYINRPVLKKEDNSLFQATIHGWEEIAYFHFRRSKQWPLNP